MKIKNIIAKGFLFCLLAGSFSCNYLDIVPDNTVEISHLFESKEKAYSALTACYSYMPNFEKFHQSMSLAGDEFVGRLDAEVADNRGNTRGEKLMRGWQNSNDPILSFWNGRGGAKSLYQGIRICNIFLQNIQNVPGMTPEDVKDWTAQVNILKAYYHFYLIRLYGPIVIVDKNLEPFASPDEVQQIRQPVEDCFKYVVDLINSVLYDENGNEKEDLAVQQTAAFFGQIDRCIAKAIKAQVLLLRASPMFNGNSEFYSNFKNSDGTLLFPMEYDKEKWKDALDATEEAIKIAEEKGHKELYTYEGNPKFWDEANWKDSEIIQYCFNNRYSIVDPWNKELIWGFSNLDYEGQGSFAHSTQCRSIEDPGNPTFSWQWLGSSYAMLERFYTKNGVPLNEDKTWDYEGRLDLVPLPEDNYHKGFMQNNPLEQTVRLHIDREPRFYAWMMVDRCIFRTHELIYDMKMRYNELPGGHTSNHNTDFYWSGMGVKKLVHPNSKNGHWARVVKFPFPIIRLADLYLMYAEAYNEYYGPDQKVYEKLNAVRARAGLLRPIEDLWNDASIVKDPGKHLTQDGLRDIIQTERLIELSFEGHSYFDILRWKRAGEFYNTPVKGWDNVQPDPDLFFQVQTLQERLFESPKSYLFPIPLDEMNKNPKLVQNPGY